MSDSLKETYRSLFLSWYLLLSRLSFHLTFPLQSECTNLNQFGRQSSLFSQASPSVKRPVTQPLHFGELGQLKKGMCWYPMSLNLQAVQ